MIDNKTVITGSFNWSPSAAHTNDETLLIIESPQLAKHFTSEMDRLWRGRNSASPHGCSGHFSDERSNAALGSRGDAVSYTHLRAHET